jgi:hypothetical protein
LAPLACSFYTKAARWLGHEPYVDRDAFLGGVAAAFFFRFAGRLLIGCSAPSGLALDVIAFGLTCAIALFLSSVSLPPPPSVTYSVA